MTRTTSSDFLDERAQSAVPTTGALSGNESRDRALAALRAMTRGPKGDRLDYVGTLSTADATVLIDLLDRVLPLYDQHAFGADELRYLTLYRGLNDEGRAQADKFLQYLVACRGTTHRFRHGAALCDCGAVTATEPPDKPNLSPSPR